MFIWKEYIFDRINFTLIDTIVYTIDIDYNDIV